MSHKICEHGREKNSDKRERHKSTQVLGNERPCVALKGVLDFTLKIIKAIVES